MIQRCIPALLCTVLGFSSADVWAQPDPCYADPPPAQKEAARSLHKEAQKLLDDVRFGEAAEAYRRSLEHWQDARVHLRTGIAFMNAMRLLEAHHHIRESLRCGQTILLPDQIDNARERLRRLRTRLAEVTVACQEPAAQVLFNDQPWFTCAGRQTRTVVAGQYVITVQKPGYFTVFKPVTVEPNQRVTVTPTVLSVEAGTLRTRRWPTWRQWALIGSGAALGLIGGGLQWRASAGLDDYRRALAAQCSQPAGCTRAVAATLQARQDRAIVENRLAVGALVLAGASLAAGLTLTAINHRRSQRHRDAGTAKVRFAPMASPTGAGLSLGLDFE